MAINWGLGQIGPSGYKPTSQGATMLKNALDQKRMRERAGIASSADIAMGVSDPYLRNEFLRDQGGAFLGIAEMPDDRQMLELESLKRTMPIDYQTAHGSVADKPTGAPTLVNKGGRLFMAQPVFRGGKAGIDYVPLEEGMGIASKTTGLTPDETIDYERELQYEKDVASLQAELDRAEEIGDANAVKAAKEELARKRAELSGATYKNVTSSAFTGQSLIPQLEELESVLKATEQGAYQPVVNFIKKYTGQDVSAAEDLDALVLSIAKQRLMQQSGVKTDMDFIQEVNTLQTTGKSAEANRRILARMKREVEDSMRAYEQMKIYERESGKPDVADFIVRPDLDTRTYEYLIWWRNPDNKKDPNHGKVGELLRAKGVIQ